MTGVAFPTKTRGGNGGNLRDEIMTNDKNTDICHEMRSKTRAAKN